MTPATDTIVLDNDRAAAFDELAAYYADVYGKGRNAYAIPPGALTDPTKQHEMAAFFWWTAWAASTNRPGQDVTYTQNWPHEELIGNRPTGGTVVWSVVSFVLLLAAVGGMVWYFASQDHKPSTGIVPRRDPLLGLHPTPSQKATVKYFFVVAALWVVQVALGAIVAHYGVEGNGFYGIPLAKFLPYSIARTWHLQIGIFWIATSWLATGLYIVPAVSGAEPKGQRLGVNVLFVAVVAVVVGSLAGEWMGIEQKLGNLWFWLGSQGYEYVDLGRLWQILLFVGLTFWLWLMWRGLKPALARRDENHSLLMLFLISSIAIPLFYAAGLMYGQRSPLITAEYWRWWVVHLWVEGFFEVFATVVIAFLLTRLKLLSISTATRVGVVLDRGLSLRRNHRHLPSPLLHRRAELGAGAGSGVQRAGSGSPGADRLRGLGEHSPVARHRRQSVDQRLQVADLLLRRRGVLELRRRRPVRLHDQPAHRALLRAGSQPDSGTRTHRPVRRVRHVGPGPDAVLPARAASRAEVERPPAGDRVLVDQHRLGRHGRA